jgi:FAD/FMN-containing dehydrogenase
MSTTVTTDRTAPSTTSSAELAALRARCSGSVLGPADEGWDAARMGWNLAFDQRPAAVAHPVDERDVAAVVSFARDRGLRVAPQGTGHNPGPLGDLSGTILLKTSAMTGVEVDPASRTARVRAGALWMDAVGPVGAHGLAALSGSSPDVGVVGYSLGGGIGWLARKYGMQTNSITAVELVTADGELVRADRNHEPDLFWALRGGGGNFGVVTALEFALHPVAEVYAGALVWDWQHAGRVLARWSEWSATAPDEITTSARILQMPPIPEVPEPLRGRQLVMIDGAYAGDPDAGDAVLGPLRELGPELDSFGVMPAADLVRLHGDPEEPMPGLSDHAMLDALPPEAVEAFVATAGPGSGSPLLMAELRQLGGALGRTPAEHGALPTLDASFAMFAAGVPFDAEVGAAVVTHARRLVDTMAPWGRGRSYLNFTEGATDLGTAYREDSYARLRALRARVDPDGVLHANHAIEPSAWSPEAGDAATASA